MYSLKSRFSNSVGINADMVARYKCIERMGRVQGFYFGNSFANRLGTSTQVPNKVEIISNNTVAKIEEIPYRKKDYIPVNENNVFVLQMLELLKDLDAHLDNDYKDTPEVYSYKKKKMANDNQLFSML